MKHTSLIKYLYLLSGITMNVLGSNVQPSDFKSLYTTSINNLEKLAALYPKTIEEIDTLTQNAIIQANHDIEEILSIKNSNRTFQNTVQALDHASALLDSAQGTIGMLAYVHPDKTMLDALENAKTTLQNASIDLCYNPKLYKAIQHCHDHQDMKLLTAEDQLLLQDTLISFKKNGLHLPKKKLEQVKQLSKDLAKLRQDFRKNINQDNTTMLASKDDLAGLSQDFLNKLKRSQDLYIITLDFPIYKELMEECHISETRKKIWLLRSNTAYPENDHLLTQILHKQQELAELIGYPNFAALDLADTDAKNIETVEQFLTTLQDFARTKAEQEISLLAQNLPEDITINQGLNPWDYAYLTAQYKKKHFNIDETKIAEYFPAQQTLEKMLQLYQDFLHVTFKQVTPSWSWHPDVQLIEIYRGTEFLGYLFLDLYPRTNKFKHACQYGQIASYQINGQNIASVAAIIANFPQATEDKPALLSHNAVRTFFHEFGHAMHHALGRTKHAGHAGTQVKNDFVETPSQMFEQWMSEPEILQQISSHYQTAEPLPVEIIQKKINLKQFDSGMFFLRQLFFGLYSLHSMTNQSFSYNPDNHWKTLYRKLFDNLLIPHEQDHGYGSFGHIASTLYASKYYAYAWTEIFAYDLFDHIKEHNFDEESKQKVIKLLSAGGSIPPQQILIEFLGRNPNQNAFLKHMGF